MTQRGPISRRDPATQRDPTYVPFSRTRRTSAEARAARGRLPVVWLVAAGTIALVFVLALVLALLL